jgi:hypothetical protein
MVPTAEHMASISNDTSKLKEKLSDRIRKEMFACANDGMFGATIPFNNQREEFLFKKEIEPELVTLGYKISVEVYNPNFSLMSRAEKWYGRAASITWETHEANDIRSGGGKNREGPRSSCSTH